MTVRLGADKTCSLLELDENTPEAQISFQDSKLLDFFQDPKSDLGELRESAVDGHLEILCQCVESLIHAGKVAQTAIDIAPTQPQREPPEPHSVLRDFAVENFINHLVALNETDMSDQAIKRLLALLESLQEHSAIVAQNFESPTEPKEVYSGLLFYLTEDDDAAEATSEKGEETGEVAGDNEESGLDSEKAKEPDQPQLATEVADAPGEAPPGLSSDPVSNWAATWEDNVQMWLKRARNMLPEGSTTDDDVFDPSDLWKEVAKEHAKSWLKSSAKGEALNRFRLARECLRLVSL